MKHANLPLPSKARSCHPRVQRLGPWALAGLLSVLPIPIPAADADGSILTFSQVRSGAFRPGDRRTVIGKYEQLINQELKLHKIDIRFIVKDQALAQQILNLKPGGDNLAVQGVFLESGGTPGETPPTDKAPAFQVERIETAPSDVEIYEKRLGELLSGTTADPKALDDLGTDIILSLEVFPDQPLMPIARRTFSEVFLRADAVLAPDDADGRLALIRRIHTALKNTEFILPLLRAQIRRFKDHGPTVAFLGELKCFQVQGEWVDYGTFKRNLGFVPLADHWVKPARREFMAIVDRLVKDKDSPSNLLLRSKTDREYGLLARSGKVEKGMTREELSDAIGLPDRVERSTAGGIEVDQWNYGERRVYLLNGQVVAGAP